MHVESIVMFLDVSVKKFDVLWFPNGWSIAETSLSNKLQTTISRIGKRIVEIIKRTPTKPIEFFINTVLDKIKSIPSLK